MSPEELRVREEAACSAFLRSLREDQHPRGAEEGGSNGDDDGGGVAPFEHNLEVRGGVRGILRGHHGGVTGWKGHCVIVPHPAQTWRQLWRVLEMSDIILLITDARHPVSPRRRQVSRVGGIGLQECS